MTVQASISHGKRDVGQAVRRLLADAEAGKDVPEQLVGIDLPGDPAQRGMCQAQLLGGQFQPFHRQLGRGGLGMGAGLAQAVDLARTCAELAIAGLVHPCAGQRPQCRVQLRHPLSGQGRNPQLLAVAAASLALSACQSKEAAAPAPAPMPTGGYSSGK